MIYINKICISIDHDQPKDGDDDDNYDDAVVVIVVVDDDVDVATTDIVHDDDDAFVNDDDDITDHDSFIHDKVVAVDANDDEDFVDEYTVDDNGDLL